MVGGWTTKTFVFQLPVNGEDITRARQQPASYSAGQKRQFGMLLDIRSVRYLQAGGCCFASKPDTTMCCMDWINRLTTTLTRGVFNSDKIFSHTTLLKLDIILCNDFRSQGDVVKWMPSITYITILREINLSRDRACVN